MYGGATIAPYKNNIISYSYHTKTEKGTLEAIVKGWANIGTTFGENAHSPLYEGPALCTTWRTPWVCAAIFLALLRLCVPDCLSQFRFAYTDG